jgi:transcription elongation factor GreA
MEKIPMTREGYLKMEKELHNMKFVEMKECLQNLSDAREKGDLSENAEYDVAKQALDDLTNKMEKVSKLLQNSHIIDTVVDDGTVQLLTWVKFKNLKLNKDIEYKIVPEYEINLKEGKISQHSPIGKSLMNKKVGDKVIADIPAGKVELEILNIRVK